MSKLISFRSKKSKKEEREENVGNVVWCQNSPSAYEDPNLVYTLCRVVEKNNANYVLSECRNQDQSMTFVAKAKDVYPANTNQIPKEQENLFQLEFLNNPVIIHHLYERYQQELFFSKIGPVLLFVNPHKSIQCDDKNGALIKKYKSKKSQVVGNLPIHLYHTVHAAINNITALQKSQSIIITGASGSGRSELLKQVIHFLTYTNKNAPSNSNEEPNINYEYVADVFEAANCIMEAFGNAKTNNNENASSFIKVYTVCLNDQQNVCHFNLRKYFFNAKQLINVKPNETLYHVFYYILLGASEPFKRKYFFRNIKEYKLLEDQIIPSNISYYEHKFKELQEALRIVCKEEKEIDFVYSTLSAILLLGNIEGMKMKNSTVITAGYICEVPKKFCSTPDKIKAIDETIFNSDYDQNTKIILAVSHLLELNPETLVKYLTTGETERLKISNSYVNLLCDIMKRINNCITTLYHEVFEWIINKINTHYDMNRRKNTPYLCIMDTPYYDNTTNNTLETLIMNTAMEGIRKCYADFFFKKRWNVYKGEGILNASDEAKYTDNENLVNALIGKGESLFSFLDNAYTNANLNRNNLCASIIKRFYKTQMIKECPTERGKNFIVKHSCGAISYHAETFLETNKNVITKDFIRLIKNSKDPLVQQLCPAFKLEVNGQIFETINKYPHQTAGGSLHSLKSEYDAQRMSLVHAVPVKITELMKLLENTFFHIVFCINSNKENQEMKFDKAFVVDQVTLFDFTELSQLKSHYLPYNLNFNKFLERYAELKESANEKKQRGSGTSSKRSSAPSSESKVEIKGLMESLKIPTDQWYLGRNMIFFSEEGIQRVFYSLVPIPLKVKKEFSLRSKASELLETMQNLALGKKKKKNSTSTNYCDGDTNHQRSSQDSDSLKEKCNGKGKRTKSETTIDHDETNDNDLDNLNEEESYMKFQESLRSLNLETAENFLTMQSSKKMMHACDVTHIIKNASRSSEKLPIVSGSLQCIQSINEQLMRDNIYSQSLSAHFHTKQSLFNIKEEEEEKEKESTKKSKHKGKKGKKERRHSHKNKHHKHRKHKSKNEESNQLKNQPTEVNNIDNIEQKESACGFINPLTLLKKLITGDFLNLCFTDSLNNHALPLTDENNTDLVLPENMQKVHVEKRDTFEPDEKPEKKERKKRHKKREKKPKMISVPVLKLDTFLD